MEEMFDFEKDHLVIYKDLEGRLSHYNWISDDKHPLEEVKAKIIEWNKKTAENKDIYDKTAELVTDQLIRDICALTHKKLQEKAQEESGETIRKDALDRIRRAIDLLQDVESDLE
ncbi:MAG: hypothetical protein LBC76_08030 [Treponema sp.]|jgi:hypothetical protein|nr:hypothetical protein [Treponema sp.]